MFRPVKVFDVSQTDGKPLPELASSLSGNVQNYEAFMEALRRSAPVPLSVEPMAANMDGYFSPDQQRIAIRAGMSEVQTVSAAVHEIAHSKLHNYAKAQEEAARAGDKEPPKKKDRNTEEVEAESISYAVCQYYGIQTGENSFGYIANWSQGKELPELRASLETINKAAGELIADIDRHYKVICKERGIDLAAQSEQTVPQQEAASEAEVPMQAPARHAYKLHRIERTHRQTTLSRNIARRLTLPQRYRREPMTVAKAEPRQPAEETPEHLLPAPKPRRPCCWLMMPPIFMFSPATPAGTTHSTMPPPGSSWTAASWTPRSFLCPPPL